MNELLYEIGVEELPSAYIHPAAEALKEGVLSRLSSLGVTFGDVSVFATPRRLALSIKDLPGERPKRSVKHYGPPAKAAYDSNGALTRAGAGFAKSKGVDTSLLKVEKTDKGDYLCVEIQEGGEPLREILAATLSQVTLSLSFPKSMTWGGGGVSFARPIRWIVAVFGGQTVDAKIGGINAGAVTSGHRFMSSGQIGVKTREDYLSALRKSFVIADAEERKRTILAQAKAEAEKHGVELVEDDELLETVAYITEWPVALWGSFDKEFLALPEELLVTTMKHHQKMFAVKGADGKVTNGFIGVSNTATPNADAIVAGYRRVLRARLSDAKFFFDEDRKKTLESFNLKLEGVLYQKKLGTMSEKARRITALTEWLADRVDPLVKVSAVRAASLCKADLATQMVFEFPELQGVMGREYARHSGEPEEVAVAIHEHYMPKGAHDALPSTLAGAMVGVADRMDSIVGCFGIGLVPSGAQDPFALRRNALGIIQIAFNRLPRPISLSAFIDVSVDGYGDRLETKPAEIKEKVLEFFAGRLKSLWTSGGATHDVADAVLSSGFDDLEDANQKVEALKCLQKEMRESAQTDKSTFWAIASTFKRVANITKDVAVTGLIDESAFEKPVEGELLAEIKKAEADMVPLTASKNHVGALRRIAALSPIVDRFFEDVMVMAEDEKVKNNRLSLLVSIREMTAGKYDFSKLGIYGSAHLVMPSPNVKGTGNSFV